MNLLKNTGFIFCLFLPFFLVAQTKTDSIRKLDEVVVKAYLSDQKLISVPSSVAIINQSQIKNASVNSVLPALNGVSGVRMEERSPGSYRLSLRGSLLRSPFGVRNVKVYFDDFPLTDASGNTYLNLIDQSGIKNIEILKGPDGSLFGANSGGVVQLSSFSRDKETSANIRGGSFGFFNEQISFQRPDSSFSVGIQQAYQKADGYRNHSNMNRNYFQTQEKWNYRKNLSLKFSGFYSDLQYETPGGLTLIQQDENRRAARPATATAPGPVAQKAAIYNKTFFAGIGHEAVINSFIKHYIGFSGIFTDFKNPFITNYETRKENSFALRTYVELQNRETNNFRIRWNTGGEFQQSSSRIINYRNNFGEKAAVLAADKITSRQDFVFSRLALLAGEHFKAEASVSLNFFSYTFKPLPQSVNNIFGEKNFKETFMPRFAASYLFNEVFSLRATVSKGYSPPTIAEVRASNAVINPDLEAEQGWNYEFGFRLKDRQQRFFADISAYTFKLNNAIVRRVNSADQEFFVNAGGTNQNGVEAQLSYQAINKPSGIIKKLDINSAITLNDFNFRNYIVGTSNFSGNDLTGVADKTISGNVDVLFFKNLSLFMQYLFVDDTPLNDANTFYADSYNLLQGKISYQRNISNKIKMNIAAGSDNVLNEKYSLGNDLNAFGSRFYNPAPQRNYFLELGVMF